MSACREEQTPSGGSVVCTPSIVPGIRIEVLDREEGFAISCGIVASIIDGDYSEQLENPADSECFDTQMLTGAFERKGVYDVSVSKVGYRDWSVTDVDVFANVCHVNTITIQVYLEK